MGRQKMAGFANVLGMEMRKQGRDEVKQKVRDWIAKELKYISHLPGFGTTKHDCAIQVQLLDKLEKNLEVM